ncbi:hypothetical protein PG984_003189 [Apiospora sp. TS-2023a]
MSPERELIECKTIDGTIIRGFIYPVEGAGPAVIMSHGVQMSLPDLAEEFQAHGYNAIVYDARSIGASDGMPRNETDPLQMAADLSDIITHVSYMPTVESRRILLWGLSFGGMLSGLCAAVDGRLKGVVMVAPLFSFIQATKHKSLFPQLINDRISQVRGNKALTLQPFDSCGRNPAGMGGAEGPGGLESYNLMRAAAETGHPTFRDRITLQTYYKLALARPKEIIQEFSQEVPVMMIVPELDDISAPSEQKGVFDTIKAPKRLYWSKGAGHLSIMTGKGAAEIKKATEDFFEDALKGEVK